FDLQVVPRGLREGGREPASVRRPLRRPGDRGGARRARRADRVPRLRLVPEREVAMLESADFDLTLAHHGVGPLLRGKTTTLQVNVGKRCNQACHHCHVEAGPTRTEIMGEAVAGRVLDLLAASPGVTIVDLTGGAPELNPHFQQLVHEARALGRHVIDRCNLTVLFEPGMEDLGEFLAAHDVEMVASLPCYTAENVEKQRGHGVFDKSIDALRRLNALGYGRSDS